MKFVSNHFLLLVLMFAVRTFANEPPPPLPCANVDCSPVIAKIADSFNTAGNISLGSYAVGPATCYQVYPNGQVAWTYQNWVGLIDKIDDEYHGEFGWYSKGLPEKWTLDSARRNLDQVPDPSRKLSVYDTYSVAGYGVTGGYQSWLRQSGKFIYLFGAYEAADTSFNLCEMPIVE